MGVTHRFEHGHHGAREQIGMRAEWVDTPREAA
jgi:hypothetical protein